MPDRRLASTRCAMLLGVAALMAGVVSPAQADIVDRGTFAGSETAVPDDLCGVAVVRDSTFSGSFRIRVDKASAGQAFFQRLNLETSDVFTNPLNHKSLSFAGKVLVNELTATHVEGDIYSFTTIEAGQPFTVRDGAGNVVLRDRGVIRHRVLFDTQGDGTPGGIALDDEIVAVGGPHPGLDLTEEEFCALVKPLIS
jgi:hypothetical protein